MRIVSEGDTVASRLWILLPVGLLVGLGALFLLVPGGNVVVAIVLLVLGVALLGVLVPAARVSRRLRPGTLDVPREWFLLGEEVAGRFERVVRRGTSEVRRSRARLQLEEWVRYTVGTDTRYATRVVQSYDVPFRVDPAPGAVVGEVTLRIAPYPPTFLASNNKVRWYLVVDLELADGFTEDSRFHLPVAPQHARAVTW